MLLKVYNKLESRLQSISSIKVIEWFNDQYSGSIHAAPGIFIEFPRSFEWQTLRAGIQQAFLLVRVHAFSKLVAMQDKSFDKTVISAHFDLVNEIYRLLQGFSADYDDGNKLFNSMMRTGSEHHQYMQGWFVTTQDFSSIVYDIEPDMQTVVRPPVEIR